MSYLDLNATLKLSDPFRNFPTFFIAVNFVVVETEAFGQTYVNQNKKKKSEEENVETTTKAKTITNSAITKQQLREEKQKAK